MPATPKILVVGQGIAGTLLAWSLLRRGVQVRVAEGDLPGASSAVAAGIINPVTGKRFVKSWRFEEFFPLARAVYGQLEQELGIALWREKPIVRLLATPEEANDWAVRCAMPDYADYLAELPDAGGWSPLLKPGFRFGAIRRAARVELAPLLAAFRSRMVVGGFFLQKNFDYEEAERLAADFDHVVFCEGYRAQSNPFFPQLPWQIAKGEALLLRFSDPRAAYLTDMLKKTMTLVPLGDGTFWAGGSYQWHYSDLAPSAGERDFMLRHLREMLAAPFEVVGQVAGVRPTVKDRRPLLGRSAVNSKFFIFNGLGTKGSLLAPYCAEHLAQHILDGTPLDVEVDCALRITPSP